MEYVRLFVDAWGESHFEDVQPDFAHARPAPDLPPLDLAELTPAARFAILRFPPGWTSRGWRTSPARNFYLFLSGECEIRASAGEIRRFLPGMMLLTEDHVGKGHLWAVVGREPVVAVLVKLPE